MNDNQGPDTPDQEHTANGPVPGEGSPQQPTTPQVPARKGVVRNVDGVLHVVQTDQALVDGPPNQRVWAPQPQIFQAEDTPLANRPPSPTLLAAYWQTVRHPSAEGMASEVPGASWSRVLWGLAASSLISILLLLVEKIVRVLTANDAVQRSTNGRTTGASAPAATFDFVSWLTTAITTPFIDYAVFFLVALFVYWLCRKFGHGIGRTGRFGPDFKVLAYLLSLVSVPTGVLSGFLSFIPLVGQYAALGPSIYSLFLQYFAIRASMQLSRSRALTVIIIEIVVGTVLSVVIIAILVSIYLSAAFRPIHSGLR